MNSCILKKFYVTGVAAAAFITKEFVGNKKLIAETCDQFKEPLTTSNISDVQNQGSRDKKACIVVVSMFVIYINHSEWYSDE